jgi:integrase
MGPEDPVFTAPRGGPVREHRFAELVFKPAVTRPGLPSALRVHDRRHTCASPLIAYGASIKAVQAQLGHASATVTLDRYGHQFPDELEHLGRALGGRRHGPGADRARTIGVGKRSA